MGSSLLGTIILWLIVAIIAIVVVVYLLSWLYQRSTKEVAFVRTGFGGERVVINGGALVLPIIHETTPVNLNVVRIPVIRSRDSAVITRDRMRVDIEAEFFVRVMQERAAVAAAASTLGRRTLEPESLSELLSGKFVGSLRSVSAELTLDEMHERRGEFVDLVEQRAAEALARNGLELESVAITNLDQTDLEFFNPSNRFDAEGLTELIEKIETRRKLRNDVEQNSMLAIRNRNLESEKETLRLEKESQTLRLAQERELEYLRAEQRAQVQSSLAKNEATANQSRIENENSTREFEINRRRSAEEAQIRAEQEVEQARIAQDQELQKSRLQRDRLLRQEEIKQKHEIDSIEVTTKEDIERARIVSDRQLHEARTTADEEVKNLNIIRDRSLELARIESQLGVERARVEQEQELDTARIKRDRELRLQQIEQRRQLEENEINAKEEIERARLTSDTELEQARVIKAGEIERLQVERNKARELAEIERQIALLTKQAEEAEAESMSAMQRAKSVEANEKITTIRETEIAERIAAVDRLIANKDADTTRIAAEAERTANVVAAEAQRLHNEAENVLTTDARAGILRTKLIDRLEGIVRESVRPMEKIDAIKILHVDGLGGNEGNGQRSPTDEVIESALRYRAQAPLIDEMMKEIGVENSNVTKMGDIFRAARDAQSLADNSKKTESETHADVDDGNEREKA